MTSVADHVVPDPLSSVGVRTAPSVHGPSSAVSCRKTRPFALLDTQPVPDREVPEYVYDPERQIAVDPVGNPLGPRLDKQWTSIDGTHTDGDGGDNENYDWEEV